MPWKFRFCGIGERNLKPFTLIIRWVGDEVWLDSQNTMNLYGNKLRDNMYILLLSSSQHLANCPLIVQLGRMNECFVVSLCVCAMLLQLCRTFCYPMYYSSPESPAQGIFQARILKFPGELPDPGIEPMSLMSPALAGMFSTSRTTEEAIVSRDFILVH